MRYCDLRACALVGVLALAGCELILVDESEKDFTVDAGGRCTDCEGTCVDLETDPANCGGCGRRCDPGELCSSGTCASSMCPSGLTRCIIGIDRRTACVDTRWDSTHCGGCGQGCSDTCEDAVCTGEVCRLPEIGCDADGCVNALTDEDHCGGCNVYCDGAADETCVDGYCTRQMDGGLDGGGASCESGQTDCGALGCLDLDSDRTSCGVCGRSCGPGEQCTGGACECAFSEACGVCASPYSYPHCGGVCESYCSPDRGQWCAGSMCVAVSASSRPYDIYPDPLVGGTIFMRFATYVCTDYLTENVARVACRDGGFLGGRVVVGTLTGLAAIPDLYSVTCSGAESNLTGCSFARTTTCRRDRLLIACDAPP